MKNQHHEKMKEIVTFNEPDDWITFKGKSHIIFDKTFLHIPRTGGKAVKKIIYETNTAGYSKGPEYIKPEVISHLQKFQKTLKHVDYSPGNLYVHHPISNLKEEVKKQTQFFTLVRNPWEKMVSHYNMAMLFSIAFKYIEEGCLWDLGIWKKYDEFNSWLPPRGDRPMPRIDSTGNMGWSFEEYLDFRNNPYFNDPAMYGFNGPQNPQYNFHTQKSYIDETVHCLRYECYQEELSAYLSISQFVDSDLDYTLRNNMLHTKVGGEDYHKIPYKELYTEKTIQIVADIYKEDIEHWGFDFDTGAKRNYWSA